MADPSSLFNKAALREPDPPLHFLFLQGLTVAWVWIFVIAELSWIALSAAMDGLGLFGPEVSVPVFVFIAVFCITAVFDILWRYTLVTAARDRYNKFGHTLDASGLRIMRVARINDFTLLIQFAAGLVFAFGLLPYSALFYFCLALLPAVWVVYLMLRGY